MSVIDRLTIDALEAQVDDTTRIEAALRAISAVVEATPPPGPRALVAYHRVHTPEQLAGSPHRAFTLAVIGAEPTGLDPRVTYEAELVLYLQPTGDIDLDMSRLAAEGGAVMSAIRDQEYWPRGVSNVFAAAVAYDVDEDTGANLARLTLSIETQEI